VIVDALIRWRATQLDKAKLKPYATPPNTRPCRLLDLTVCWQCLAGMGWNPSPRRTPHSSRSATGYAKQLHITTTTPPLPHLHLHTTTTPPPPLICFCRLGWFWLIDWLGSLEWSLFSVRGCFRFWRVWPRLVAPFPLPNPRLRSRPIPALRTRLVPYFFIQTFVRNWRIWPFNTSSRHPTNPGPPSSHSTSVAPPTPPAPPSKSTAKRYQHSTPKSLACFRSIGKLTPTNQNQTNQN